MAKPARIAPCVLPYYFFLLCLNGMLGYLSAPVFVSLMASVQNY